MTRFLTKLALSRAGFDDPLFHIADAEHALTYLKGDGEFSDRSKFPISEVIFLDLKMPNVDGFQLLKWIKSQPHLCGTMVFVLTGL